MARKPDFEVKDTAEALRARGKQVASQLSELQHQVDLLNHAYLMYFRGQDKREPYKDRQILEGRLRQFKMPTMSTTVLRFKYNQLLQRMVSLRSYWDRTCRSIENGTFKFGHGPIPPAMGSPNQKSVPSTAVSPPEPPEKESPEAAKASREFETLFSDYVNACAQNDVSTKVPSYEAFERSLSKQRKATSKRVGHDRIRYEVRIRDGEAKLIAVIKKKK